MRRMLIAVVFLAAGVWAGAQQSPLNVAAALQASGTGAPELSVVFTIPAHHHIYADQIKVEPLGAFELLPKSIPPPISKYDAFQEKTVGVYEQDSTFVYSVRGNPPQPFQVKVSYQGCSETLCYLPASKSFSLSLSGATAPVAGAAPAAATRQSPPAGWRGSIAGFGVAGRAVGYVGPEKFIAFLDDADSGRAAGPDALRRALDTTGLWFVVLLILAGGLALNLTPCVLPMIPINLAIIGAGSGGASRGRGLALGGVYGLGIAIVYGLLGLVVVLTGAKFGALNASPWFNLAVAGVFVALSLAMFGVFNLDFSRLQRGGGPAEEKRGRFIPAFLLGGLAALLSGACVAPVIISVLLLSADQYARGNPAGLLLPFLLGFGMALPWPFAGAGLSFLPKPGRWMDRVKIGFGVLILAMAAWYGYLGVSLLAARSAGSRAAVEAASQAAEGWETSLDQGLVRASREGKPVFVDFWASWCKNCLEMERTTFRDPRVKSRLERYVKVKFRAEDISAPDIKATLDYFGAVGLPTYVVLRPSGR